METIKRFNRSIEQIVVVFLLVCLFPIGAVEAADKPGPSKPVPNKAIEASKTESMRNSESPEERVKMSEEIRNHKTFQVGRIEIKASPEVVFNTFTDYKRAPIIFSYCKNCRIVSSVGPTKRISFEAELAGGLFKFEYVLEFREYKPKLVEWHRVSGAFKANEGYWKFEPLEGGKKTLVTYCKYVEAGFPFPQFVVKSELHNNMPVILTELKNAVEKSN